MTFIFEQEEKGKVVEEEEEEKLLVPGSPPSPRLAIDWKQALTRFSISRKSREEMVHFFLSRAGELNFHFSRCSWMSRFWRKNSRSPLEIRDLEKKFSFSSRRNEILQTDSLSLLDSSLNVFSNSREKSYFALWVDFDHQCFAERESILKRQFCVVEQYSDFSLQKHFMETTTTKSLLWEGMVAQWKGQMQNMQEWDRRLTWMES